jgi:uncharacterized membrane protein YccC
VAATKLLAIAAAACRHVGSDYGPSLGVAGFLLFLISLESAGGPGGLWNQVGGILLGGAIGLALQMALWPFRAQHPLRLAASNSWVAAAELFDAMQPGRPADELRAAEGGLRTAYDQAARLLAGASRHRHNALADRLEALSLRAARLGVRVMAVHTALDGLRHTPVAARIEPALGAILKSLTNNARGIAVAVVSRQPAHFANCEVRLRRLEALLQSVQARLAAETNAAAAIMLSDLFAQVRIVVPEILTALRACVDRGNERALFAVELFDVQTWQLKPLASALNFNRHVDPTLVRFGLRLAVCCGLGTLIYLWWDVPHGYWIPLTVVVMMQPDYGSTRRKAGQRIIGTLGGSVLASLLIWLAPGPLVHLAGIAAGVFVFSLFLKRNYAIAAFAVTVFVVLLLDHGGTGAGSVVLARTGATLAGGLIALGAAMVFWPMWEHDRFAPVLRRAILSTRDYLRQLEIQLQSHGGQDPATVQLKRRAEAASVAVFSSVGRLFADDHNPRAEIELAALLANGNQRLLRLANLMFVGLPDATPVSPLLDPYFQAVTAGLEQLATTAATLGADRPDDQLTASMAELDHLPPVEAGAGPMPLHLARAATEVRTMLTAVAPAA